MWIQQIQPARKTSQCVCNSKDQLYKIQEVLRHPSQYRDRIKPKDCPVKGKYATAFNKFHPKKVKVNETTVKEAIKYGQFLKKSKEDIAEAIDIYNIGQRNILRSRRRSRGPTGTTTTMTTSQVCSRKIFFLNNNICPQAIGLFHHCPRKKDWHYLPYYI